MHDKYFMQEKIIIKCEKHFRASGAKCPWRQVVPNYSQRQDVLRDKKVASSCLASRSVMSRCHVCVKAPFLWQPYDHNCVI